MKKRTLLTNIFIVILMVSIVFVLLAFFDVFDKNQNKILFASMSVALISVALVDIVFPLIDNFRRFLNETSYKIKTIVKVLLFAVAIVFLVCTVKGVAFFSDPQFVGIAFFCAAYLAQFFIDLDKNKQAENAGEEEFDDEDENESYNESYNESDNESDNETYDDAYDDGDDSFVSEDDEIK